MRYRYRLHAFTDTDTNTSFVEINTKSHTDYNVHAFIDIEQIQFACVHRYKYKIQAL